MLVNNPKPALGTFDLLKRTPRRRWAQPTQTGPVCEYSFAHAACTRAHCECAFEAKSIFSDGAAEIVLTTVAQGWAFAHFPAAVKQRHSREFHFQLTTCVSMLARSPRTRVLCCSPTVSVHWSGEHAMQQQASAGQLPATAYHVPA